MKKSIAVLLTILCLMSVMLLGGCDYFDSDTSKLTLKKVKELAKKGEDLSWSDFERFDHEDIGSGLYIYAFDVDEDYRLLIGGGSPDIKPYYIMLTLKTDDSEYIDIRTDSVDDFIKKH